jgi:hypothetical protein
MQEGNTARVMAADMAYGEFYDFQSLSPEYFGYHHVVKNILEWAYELKFCSGRNQETPMLYSYQPRLLEAIKRSRSVHTCAYRFLCQWTYFV